MKAVSDFNEQQDIALAQWGLERACDYGATAAEVLILSAEAINAGVRLGQVEKLKNSRERRFGLRVFVGQSSACASTSELEASGLKRFIEETVALARITARDPWAGLPSPELHPRAIPDLNLNDFACGLIAPEKALELARRAEKAALSFHPAITNSEGAEFNSSRHLVVFANSQGFTGAYQGTSYSLVVVPIARSDSSMQRDYWYTASRHFDGLDDPEQVGLTAAKRALRRLGARKIATTKVPVIFEPEIAAGLLRTLANAACGDALHTRASFLVDKLGEEIAAPTVTVVDDPLMPAALGSKPFDGEGVACKRKVVIERGRLVSYLLDSYSARKLGLVTTGNAARGVGSPPSPAPTNLYLEPGNYSPEQIVRSVKKGLLVTELIGFGVNLVTGDYSRGAAGFWIEEGEIAFPVEEITIAGNLKRMLLDIEMVGNDLQWRSSVASPTIKIAEMTVAGS